MLEIKGLEFGYKNKKIFFDLNFSLKSSGLFCVAGPNGAGKSTLLKLIIGYLRPQKGQILYNGKNLLWLSPASRAKIASFVPQKTNLVFDLSTCEFILSGCNPYLLPTDGYSDKDIEICHNIAQKLGIENLLQQDFCTLSAGEAQKAQIARVLIQNTPVLLLDETLAHLDLKHQLETLKLLKNLAKTKIVVLVSHNLNLALEYSNEIIFLKSGKILRQGDPSQITTEELLLGAYDCKLTLDKNQYTGKPLLLFH